MSLYVIQQCVNNAWRRQDNQYEDRGEPVCEWLYADTNFDDMLPISFRIRMNSTVNYDFMDIMTSLSSGIIYESNKIMCEVLSSHMYTF